MNLQTGQEQWMGCIPSTEAGFMFALMWLKQIKLTNSANANPKATAKNLYAGSASYTS